MPLCERSVKAKLTIVDHDHQEMACTMSGYNKSRFTYALTKMAFVT